MAAAKAAGHPLTAATQMQITDHALAIGFTQAFLVSAAIGLLALIVAVTAIWELMYFGHPRDQ